MIQSQKKSIQKLLSKQTTLKNKRQIFAKNTVLLKVFALSMLPSYKEVIMHTEEHVLIPQRMIMSTQPTKSEIFYNHVYN